MGYSKKLFSFGLGLVAALGLFTFGKDARVNAAVSNPKNRIIVTTVGSTDAGKSSILNKILGREVGDERCTIGSEFGILRRDGYSLIWNAPSGIERMRSFALHDLKIADIAIIVFNISKDSIMTIDERITAANNWYNFINDKQNSRLVKTFYLFN